MKSPTVSTQLRLLLLISASFVSVMAGQAAPVSFTSPDGYRSPYKLQFTTPESTRTAGWDRAPWNTPEHWGFLSYNRWYDNRAYRLRSFENLAYGAQPIHFPASGKRMNAALRQERVITAASQYFGMHYQHHHIPTFNPYPTHPDWPWIKVKSGIRGAGLDCSNFVAWIYNYALGVELSGSVIDASRRTTVSGPGRRPLTIQSFNRQQGISFQALVAQLHLGDVIYIRGNNGHITHSVLWIGSLAVDSNGKDKYFVIDSTGAGTRDSNGVSIPDGVHIRPFRENSWYFHGAAIIHRIIRENP
ncbi:MAG: NlpC/P60 family protein [Chthoniobacterales bacterium]